MLPLTPMHCIHQLKQNNVQPLYNALQKGSCKALWRVLFCIHTCTCSITIGWWAPGVIKSACVFEPKDKFQIKVIMYRYVTESAWNKYMLQIQAMLSSLCRSSSCLIVTEPISVANESRWLPPPFNDQMCIGNPNACACLQNGCSSWRVVCKDMSFGTVLEISSSIDLW